MSNADSTYMRHKTSRVSRNPMLQDGRNVGAALEKLIRTPVRFTRGVPLMRSGILFFYFPGGDIDGTRAPVYMFKKQYIALVIMTKKKSTSIRTVASAPPVL